MQPEQDRHTVNIVVARLALVLEYIARFYSRQMQVSFSQHPDLLRRLETLLDHYYKEGKQHVKGLPTVRYCAQELFLSPNYFGDLVKELTGDSATVSLTMVRLPFRIGAGRWYFERKSRSTYNRLVIKSLYFPKILSRNL